eukprot:jgi/Chlat1/6842/Chrsp51S06528
MLAQGMEALSKQDVLAGTSLARRVFWRALLVLPLAAALWLGPDWATSVDARINGRISSSYLANFTHNLGAFTVDWNGATLQVLHQRNLSRPLWSSIPGRAFISVAGGIMQVRNKDANFHIKDRWEGRTLYQSVDRISAYNDTHLQLQGLLWLDTTPTNYSFTLSAVAENQLAFEVEWSSPSSLHAVNHIVLTYASSKEEQFFGLGEQFSYFNLKGLRVPVLSCEQGIGRGLQPYTFVLNLLKDGAAGGWQTTYTAVPHYVSSLRRSLFLEGYQYTVFNFRRPTRVAIEAYVTGHRLRGRIVHGETPLDLIKEYTDYTGRMQALPSWASGEGAIVGLQGGTDDVLRTYNVLKAAGVRISALWLQDWTGIRKTEIGQRLWWNWELDEAHYPRWKQMMCDLDADGVKLMTYMNPYLVDVALKGDHRRNLFREARSRGYLVQNVQRQAYMLMSGTPDFHFGMLDLTNPACRAWVVELIKENVLMPTICPNNKTVNVAGWMADFGEHLPFDAVLHSGESATVVHNRYPEDWAKINRQAVRDAGLEGQVVFFSRSGSTRSPSHSPLFWMGDQLVSWDEHDGIMSALTGMLSGGVSGFALSHSDVGGYTMTDRFRIRYLRTKELLYRWMELSAFTDAVFRTHQGILPHKSVQVYSDDETLSQFALYTDVHIALNEYRRELMFEATTRGAPLVRHPWLHYPEDPCVYELRAQFMLGSDFMVAPVMAEGISQVAIYLPKGDLWQDVFTGEQHDARQERLKLTLNAPLGRPGLLIRVDGRLSALEAAVRLKALLATRPALSTTATLLRKEPALLPPVELELPLSLE